MRTEHREKLWLACGDIRDAVARLGNEILFNDALGPIEVALTAVLRAWWRCCLVAGLDPERLQKRVKTQFQK